MKKTLLIGALSLCLPIMASAQYNQGNFNIKPRWASAYGDYGYYPDFKKDFLSAVGGKEEQRVYHLDQGTVICNGDAVLDEFQKTYKKFNGSVSNSKFKGCLYVADNNYIAYVNDADSGNGHINVKFVMTKNPSWHDTSYNGSPGDFPIFSGVTSKEFIKTTKFDDFLVKDKERFAEHQKRIMWINGMPDINGVYPSFEKGEKKG